jgi:hypothetical protein
MKMAFYPVSIGVRVVSDFPSLTRFSHLGRFLIPKNIRISVYIRMAGGDSSGVVLDTNKELARRLLESVKNALYATYD